MGVFASVATLVRLKYLAGFADSRDPLWAIVPIGLWTWVEECLGMCAACIATFRPLLRLIPGVRSAASGAPAMPGGYGGSDGEVGVFVTWKSRLDGRRRARADRLGLDDLDRRSVADDWGDEEEGEGIVDTTGRSIVVVGNGEDVISGGAAAGEQHAETASIATTKDGAEIRTMVDDAESQKSIIQHSRTAFGKRY
ncbi:hypothetical protein MPH_00221 [Macrophomina phaseolina MS6]|uniref:Rhodopsin domain-containing protein n=1 Tax=Macrophomina phaseolina (strain MS6) TaxID=1126212 RepID=K2RIU2_MACPH|nr:hypothetical protein MPH_00221 [Macrophomina phaseolina MS6]